MHRNKKFVSIAALLVLVASCSPKTGEVLVKLPKIKDADLTLSLDSMSNQYFGSFYAKISTKYEDSAQSVNFKTSVRIQEDSLMNALITYARLPIFNTLISPDSIKLTNKQEKCYQLQSLGFLKENFGIDFSYRNIEELFFGMPIGYDPEGKYFRVKEDPYSYTLCSHRKKKVNRIERKEEDIFVIYYELSDDRKELLSTIIESPQDTTSIRIEYVSHMEVDEFLIPKEIKIQVFAPRQTIFVEMNFNKAEVGTNREIYFVIPESYEECK